MDYEKMYKAVLKTATQWIKDGCSDKEKICLESIFPQLAESEDERIREWLIDYFKEVGNSWIHRDISPEQILAYLERQKEPEDVSASTMIPSCWEVEQKPVDYDAELKKCKDNPLYFYDKYVYVKQKPAEYLSKDKVYAIMNKLTELSTSELIPLNSDEYKKINEITSDVRSLLDYPIEQKPNIELIQKSWYMEGYHDKEFNCEPKWIIKTGEGGPRYEENPKYGQIIEQKPAEWSEDERIRKFLVDYFTSYKIGNVATKLNGVRIDDILNYLEKQKEQKHPNGCFTCDEYKKGYEEGRRNGFTAGYNKAMKEVEQKEQKPVVTHGETYHVDTLGTQQVIAGKMPQKSAEWSEEDEEMLQSIIKDFRAGKVSTIGQEQWLKSLRTSWKPSEEQMTALKNSAYGTYQNGDGPALRELYNDLKKLGVKEEPEYYQHFDPDC